MLICFNHVYIYMLYLYNVDIKLDERTEGYGHWTWAEM